MGRLLPMTMDAPVHQTPTAWKAYVAVESAPMSALSIKEQGHMTPGAIAPQELIAFQILAMLTLALLTVPPLQVLPMHSPVLALRMMSASQPIATLELVVTHAQPTERRHLTR